MALISSLQGFYIGGTASPNCKWWEYPRDIFRSGPSWGHVNSHKNMKVVAVRRGAAGGLLEKDLILAAKGRFGDRCNNVANDSRGLSRNPTILNWIYVCS